MADECPPKNGLIQLGIGQYPAQETACLDDLIKEARRCGYDVLIGADNEPIENPVCAEEFYARALSRSARSNNFTLGTSPVTIVFPTKFNRVIIINDGSGGEIISISLTPVGNPSAALTASALSNTSQFYDAHPVYNDESRTFEVWSDTITLVSDTAATPGRISLFFP